MTRNESYHRILELVLLMLQNAGLIDANEPESTGDDRYNRRTIQTVLDGDIPATVSISNLYQGQRTLNVALWPREGGEAYIGVSNAKALAGDVFVVGWVNQRENGTVAIEYTYDAQPYIANNRKDRIAQLSRAPSYAE